MFELRLGERLTWPSVANSMPTSLHPATTLLWFKRDLRVDDHAALCAAAEAPNVLPVFFWERAVHGAADASPRQRQFIADSLGVLQQALVNRGSGLLQLQGDAVELLATLHACCGFERIVSHQETGNAATFERDRRVAQWCRDHSVVWDEYTQDGVVRRLRSRNGWSKRWDARVRRLPLAAPERLPPMPKLDAAALGSDVLPRLDGTAGDTDGLWQRGGSVAACAALDGFLSTRGETYRSGMSSPLTGPDVCSRISPHLAHGTLSLSQVVAALGRRRAEVQAEPPSPSRSRWLASLKSFEGRLYWHCHFMQKLESDPRIEFENMVRGFDGLREADFSREHFERWSAGQTGYPLVDACMRMLAATGWLNFRMRAMLVSFAAFPLWLHWREPGLHLARLFTDYEPGIHWSQMQMQSGTTGINAVRIYNPVKQAHDQDPDGVFVRRWCPELAELPTEWLFEPWKLPGGLQSRFGVSLGHDYPLPVVDFAVAARTAKARLTAFRHSDAVRREAGEVMQRHGSRKSGIRQRGERPSAALARSARPAAASPQLGFDFDGESA